MVDGVLAELAREAGLRVVAEGFVDRGYRDDGRLVPREEPGALIREPGGAAEQAVRLAGSGRVESLCLHGDGADAPAVAAAVRTALHRSGIQVRPFA